MAVSGSAVHNNQNNFVFFIMDTCLSNILESTKEIEMKLD